MERAAKPKTFAVPLERACQDLARRSYGGLWAHPVGMLIVTLGSPLGEAFPGGMWLATMVAMVTAGVRWVAANRTLASPARMTPETYCRVAGGVLVLSATWWGALAWMSIVTFGSESPATHLVFLIMAGIAAGGILATAPLPPLLVVYTCVPWVLGLAAHLWVADHAWAAVLVKLIYFGFLLAQGLRMARQYAEGVQREWELEQARGVAEASNAAKDRFLASMSHEIRTPMSGILGTLALLDETGLRRDQRELVLLARESAEGLLGLLNEVLDLAKVTAGHMSLERVEFDLPALCTSAVGMFRGSASVKGVALQLESDLERGELVMGDPTRLRQVLANLIGNAVKFTERGSIRLQVSRQGDSVQFAVADTGVGIPRDRLGAIFSAFVQAGHRAPGEDAGTGLGLAISQEIVALMGGQLKVDSAPGKGSRFWFQVDLPLVSEPAAAAAAAPPGPTAAAPAPPEEQAAPVRVLLVEDTTVNQRVVLGMLRLLGHEADLATNGAEALDAVARRAYDLVLMDIQMPVMDGLEATGHIRTRETAHGIPRTAIHGLSANAYAADRERGLAAGMDGYLTKPVGLDQLRALIAALPKEKEKPPAGAHAPAGGMIHEG